MLFSRPIKRCVAHALLYPTLEGRFFIAFMFVQPLATGQAFSSISDGTDLYDLALSLSALHLKPTQTSPQCP